MYDLIIVGGGPSGSSAGRAAGKKGLNTLLIEKERFPRYKPCGGALSERAVSYLDFPLPPSVREGEIFGVRVRFGESVIERHRTSRIATMVTRSVLDEYLLEKGIESGISVRMGEKVENFEEVGDHVVVYTEARTYRARFVLIAEGSQGTLRNRIRRKDTKKEYGICIVTEVDRASGHRNDDLSESLEVTFGSVTMGYGWVFPHRDYYSVGVGSFLAKSLSSPKETMVEFLRQCGFNDSYRLKGHVIPTGGIRRKLAGSRVLLIGDAAGFVDPFSGEGIAYAIRSGQIAAGVIAEIIHGGNDPRCLMRYESICRREFADGFTHALMLAKLMHRFPDFFFRLLTTHGEVFEKLTDVPLLKSGYRGYLTWLILRLPRYIFSRAAFRH